MSEQNNVGNLAIREFKTAFAWSAVRDSAQFLSNEKALDVVVLDIGNQCSFADFFVIATAQSLGHLRGLVKNIDEVFARHDIGARGTKRGVHEDDNWILLDCGDFLVHLMTQDAREFYNLEKLWFESPRVNYLD